MNAAAPVLRARRLRALGVKALYLRGRAPRHAPGIDTAVVPPAPATASGTPPVVRRLALCPDPAELHDPAIQKMYSALTEAVATAGLQSVRVCDVAADASAAVMVFGTAVPPVDVPASRVLRVDALSALHADRECRRRLWQRMRALGRGGSG